MTAVAHCCYEPCVWKRRHQCVIVSATVRQPSRWALCYSLSDSVLLAGVALSTSDSSSLFGGYFHDSTCSTPYALAAHSYNLQTLAAAIKVCSRLGVTLTAAADLRLPNATTKYIYAILMLQCAGCRARRCTGHRNI